MNSYKCQLCKRQLTNARSIALGVGPECEAKRSQFIAGCGSSEEELATIQNDEREVVKRWAKNFNSEMVRNNIRCAKQCLEAARHAMQSRSNRDPLITDLITKENL